MPKVIIDGNIDKKLASHILSLDLSSKTISIDSGGGEAVAAATISNHLLDFDTKIIVSGTCISACSEFIMPSSTNIIFQNNPIIGFHWSPILDYEQYKIRNDNVLHCKFPSRDQQLKLYKRNNLNPHFWKEIENRLDLQYYELVPKTGQCPWKRRKFRNHIWLPTSEQLRDLWKLKFRGSVCADYFERCKKQIDRRLEKGTRIVIGDVTYVSKGP